MAITKEVLDELLKECHGPDGLVKQFRTKVRAKPSSNG